MKLDYKKMIKEIDALVQTDFSFDMECKLLDGKFTQKEAKQMADLISRVYSISHCLHCEACQTKYKII